MVVKIWTAALCRVVLGVTQVGWWCQSHLLLCYGRASTMLSLDSSFWHMKPSLALPLLCWLALTVSLALTFNLTHTLVLR